MAKARTKRLSQPGKIALDPARAKRILETTPAIIYVYDVESERIVYQNRPPGGLLGYAQPLAQRMESEWRALIHPDDARALPDYRRRLKAIKSGEVVSWEFRVRDAEGEWQWFAAHDVLLTTRADGSPRHTVGSANNVTHQKKAQEHRELLIAEMRHRTRNLTTIIDSIARQSLPKGETGVEQYYKVLMARLQALFSAAEIVMASPARIADLGQILEAAVEPFRKSGAATRIELDGPAVLMPEETAASVALAVHELATNATKYGALSSSEGAVKLAWSLHPANEGSRLEISWKERGGPPVVPPAREGFGSRVIRHAATRQKDGKVELEYAPDGISCRIGFALAA